MLDALNQWAMNPTSMSAGYGIEENYVYILRNLEERYPETNCKKAMLQLRAECVKLTSKYDIYECRLKIQEIIDRRNGEKLRSAVLKRVSKLTVEHGKALYLCMKLKDKIRFPYISEYNVESLISCFYAAGIVTTFQDAMSIPVKTGFFNELLWISSGTSSPQSEYCIPKFVEPIWEKTEEQIKEKISDLPNVKEYVRLLVDKRKFEQMRLLDELVDIGASNDPFIGGVVSARGIIGRYKDFVAPSLFILNELKRSLVKEKASLVQSFKAELVNVLLKLRNERFPEVELIESPLEEMEGWIMDVEGTNSLQVLLTPWILRKGMEHLKKAKSYVIITSNQSLPSISKIIGVYKDRNLTVICKYRKKFFLRMFGAKHKILDEILETFCQNGYEILEEEIPTPQTIEEIGMEPEKPFTNLTQVIELMETLKGPILLLDKHFNEKGLMFLKKINPTLVDNVKILMSKAHLSRDFKDIFKAFKDEMAYHEIIAELRILNEKDAKEIHDRYLMSEVHSYNTPPWNIINKKLGDIMRIRNAETKKMYFIKYWSRATDILKMES